MFANIGAACHVKPRSMADLTCHPSVLVPKCQGKKARCISTFAFFNPSLQPYMVSSRGSLFKPLQTQQKFPFCRKLVFQYPLVRFQVSGCEGNCFTSTSFGQSLVRSRPFSQRWTAAGAWRRSMASSRTSEPCAPILFFPPLCCVVLLCSQESVPLH